MYTRKAVEHILKQVSERTITPEQAAQKLRHLAYESLAFAQVDHHRPLRKSLPEVVYAPGKTSDQLVRIAEALKKKGAAVLITRLDEKGFRALKKWIPQLSYSKEARIAYFKDSSKTMGGSSIAVVTAGTSDVSVAEEAAVTLEVIGRQVERFYDLGIAGLHRLLDHVHEIEKADVIICIAGMEGALPSVLAGLVSKPVIAVPTSIGYGANFEGIAPLLTMLNSCAQGVAVVNIDSGFNAACFAHLLLRTAEGINANDSGEISR